MTVFGWILLGAGLVLASLPFMGENYFLGMPLIRKGYKPVWLKIIEFLCAYVVFIALGLLMEKSIGQIAPQGWAFYAVIFLLFVVAAFPAFAYRYLWGKS